MQAIASEFLKTSYGQDVPPTNNYAFGIYRGEQHLFNLNVRGNGHPPEISDLVRRVLEENDFQVPNALRDLSGKYGICIGRPYQQPESEATKVYLN